jgi:uncharacterized protein (TIGR02452 family)
MSRTTRAQSAAETLAVLDAGKYITAAGVEVDISAALEDCIAKTLPFSPEELTALRDAVLAQPRPYERTRLENANESSLQGVFRLSRRTESARIGVLNFASARNPGGGFLGGSQAQEESLARSSGLYRSLLTCRRFYSCHRAQRSLLYTHSAIYSPACPVFCDDAGAFLPEPCCVDIISCPAPNAGAVRRNQSDDVGRIEDVLRERMSLILGLAAHVGIETMVLGAWGCGVFQNSPEFVARTFQELLDQGGAFTGRFRTISFSVLDQTKDTRTYRAFADRFSPVGRSSSEPTC